MALNPDSILDSTKKILGLDFDYTEFDLDIITHINTTFMTLRQLGVGPTTGFVISDSTATWDQFTSDIVMLAGVKTYVYLKARLAFDPPQTSFAIDSLQQQINEAEWRINVVAETINPPSDPAPPVDPTTCW